MRKRTNESGWASFSLDQVRAEARAAWARGTALRRAEERRWCDLCAGAIEAEERPLHLLDLAWRLRYHHDRDIADVSDLKRALEADRRFVRVNSHWGLAAQRR